MSTNGTRAKATGSGRLLCVDDEPNVLEGLERVLFDHFDVVTASSAADGLELLRSEGPFGVVVSDMQMPEMDGAEFLGCVRQSAPETVRVLLTGQADIQTAIAAVNEGSIFRFLCKPCPSEVLVPSLTAAMDHYHLVTAERDLLENTLSGAVKTLTEVLNLTAPAAFNRSEEIRSYVGHMAEARSKENRWQYELAAMLSQIGCITLPPDTLDKVYAGQSISDDEQRMLDEYPATGARLLSHIPRLEPVAAMIAAQQDPSKLTDPEERLGAEMLVIARDVDRLVMAGAAIPQAVAKLQDRGGFNEDLLESLSDYRKEGVHDIVKAVSVHELGPFMVLDEEVRATNGSVLVSKGRELNGPLIERLKNWKRGLGIVEPIRVRCVAA